MLFVIELLGSLLLMYLLISLAMKSSYTKTEKIMRKGNLTLRHSKDGEILIVNKRSSSNRQLLSCMRHKINDYKYNEPKLTYTSATVGGVTTGGFSKSGDDYSVKGISTNKGELIYKYIDENDTSRRFQFESVITRIEFAEELIPLVKNSNIAKYLNKDGSITLIKKGNSDGSAAAWLWGAGHHESALNVLAAEGLNNYLDFDVCLKIYSWICDN